MHEHEKKKSDCEHELKYCVEDDVVYCEKCKKEWNKKTGISNSDYDDLKEKLERLNPPRCPYPQHPIHPIERPWPSLPKYPDNSIYC